MLTFVSNRLDNPTTYKHISRQENLLTAQDRSNNQPANFKEIKAIHHRALASISFTSLDTIKTGKDLLRIFDKYTEKRVIKYVKAGFTFDILIRKLQIQTNLYL